MPLPQLEDIERAAERLNGYAVRTPLLRSDALDQLAGCRLFVKAECLQRTGSFKFRGACNHIAQLPADKVRQGVIAYSSGNHAQGVAQAARLFGGQATIVMPHDAPSVKRQGAEGDGAEIVGYHRNSEDREAIGTALSEERGLSLIRPYDDDWVIAGQGTVGLEAAQQLRDQSLAADVAIAPCGGGGLIAGTSLALKAAFPDIDVFSAEPDGFDDTARSLVSGQREGNRPGAQSICDALLAPEPGEITFAINRTTLTGGVAVSDADAGAAMRAAFRHLKIVVEPGGAVALAAVLSGKLDTKGKTVLVVVSGGNVDAAVFAETLRTS